MRNRFLSQTFLFFIMALTGASMIAADAPNPATSPKPTTGETAGALEDDADIELASRLERAFKKLAKKAELCVVSLQVKVRPGNWLEELRHMEDPMGGGFSGESQGSGVILESNGLIVTNEHVVRSAESIRVTLVDGRDYAAEICGTDARSDLALIRIVGNESPLNLSHAVLADSDKVEVGQYALAVGNPFGLHNTFTMGVVSARKRNMQMGHLSSDVFYGNLIQTDAAINRGNSGGPLFDLRGKLIGINTIIFSKTGISQGFGFAIPSNHLQKRLAHLKEGREIEYGWLGVQLVDFKSGQKTFKVPDNKGVQINAVIPNTPADRAGLERGMIILEFDGVRVGSSAELIALVNETPVGQVAKLKALDSAGKLQEVSIRVSKRYVEQVRATMLGMDEDDAPGLDEELEPPSPSASAPVTTVPVERGVPSDKNTFQWRGMYVKELEPAVAAKRGGRLEIVRVKKGTPADRAGLFEGAILSELKHISNPAIQKFNSLIDFKRIVSPLGGQVSLYVQFNGYVIVEEK